MNKFTRLWSLKLCFKLIWLSGLLSLLTNNAFAQHFWTYRVELIYNGKPQPFYLWIPETCTQVNGVILASRGREGQLATDSTIRAACAESGIAIIGCRGDAFDGNWQPADSTLLNQALTQLADLSRFPEIRYAPIATYGTSVGGLFAFGFAKHHPQRVFAVIQDNAISLDTASLADNQKFLQIPMLSTRGSDEQVDDRWWLTRSVILKMRSLGSPANMILQAGCGHFSFTQFEARYVAKWLQKALKARLPEDAPPAKTGYTSLRNVTESIGFLSDSAFNTANMTFASYDDYVGDKSTAFWHFDQEIVELWQQMHQGGFQKAIQQLSVHPQFSSCGNPFQTCNVQPQLVMGQVPNVYIDAISSVGLGVSYGHYGAPLNISANKDSLLLSAAKYDAAMAFIQKNQPGANPNQITTFTYALQEGNADFRCAERAYRVILRANVNGIAQSINFTTLSDVDDTVKYLIPAVSTTSGLRPEIMIENGPAVIRNDTIFITPFAWLGNGGKTEVIVRYGQAGNAQFAKAPGRTDTFYINRVSFKDSVITRIEHQTKVTSETLAYPNPVFKELNVKVLQKKSAKHFSYKFVELQSGKSVPGVCYKGDGIFDASCLKSGIYLLQLIEANKVSNIRFVKQ
jgi:pimeloyl-ACP methyl ester carboxylesterase